MNENHTKNCTNERKLFLLFLFFFVCYYYRARVEFTRNFFGFFVIAWACSASSLWHRTAYSTVLYIHLLQYIRPTERDNDGGVGKCGWLAERRRITRKRRSSSSSIQNTHYTTLYTQYYSHNAMQTTFLYRMFIACLPTTAAACCYTTSPWPLIRLPLPSIYHHHGWWQQQFFLYALPRRRRWWSTASRETDGQTNG